MRLPRLTYPYETDDHEVFGPSVAQCIASCPELCVAVTFFSAGASVVITPEGREDQTFDVSNHALAHLLLGLGAFEFLMHLEQGVEDGTIGTSIIDLMRKGMIGTSSAKEVRTKEELILTNKHFQLRKKNGGMLRVHSKRTRQTIDIEGVFETDAFLALIAEYDHLFIYSILLRMADMNSAEENLLKQEWIFKGGHRNN